MKLLPLLLCCCCNFSLIFIKHFHCFCCSSFFFKFLRHSLAPFPIGIKQFALEFSIFDFFSFTLSSSWLRFMLYAILVFEHCVASVCIISFHFHCFFFYFDSCRKFAHTQFECGRTRVFTRVFKIFFFSCTLFLLSLHFPLSVCVLCVKM